MMHSSIFSGSTDGSPFTRLGLSGYQQETCVLMQACAPGFSVAILEVFLSLIPGARIYGIETSPMPEIVAASILPPCYHLFLGAGIKEFQ
jgi:hypothetical protein